MHANLSISVISGSHNYHNYFSSVIKDSLPSIRFVSHTSQICFVTSQQTMWVKLNAAFFCTRENKQTKNPNTSREPKAYICFQFNLKHQNKSWQILKQQGSFICGGKKKKKATKLNQLFFKFPHLWNHQVFYKSFDHLTKN